MGRIIHERAVLGVVDLFVVPLPFYGSFHMHNSLELGVFSGLITPVCSYILSESILCHSTVVLGLSLCCRFEPLPAEMPW